MKCPKCGYLGFETTDRCRNCRYRFLARAVFARAGTHASRRRPHDRVFTGLRVVADQAAGRHARRRARPRSLVRRARTGEFAGDQKVRSAADESAWTTNLTGSTHLSTTLAERASMPIESAEGTLAAAAVEESALPFDDGPIVPPPARPPLARPPLDTGIAAQPAAHDAAAAYRITRFRAVRCRTSPQLHRKRRATPWRRSWSSPSLAARLAAGAIDVAAARGIDAVVLYLTLRR